MYRFDVTSHNPLNSGDGSDALVSPKLSAAFGPWAATEFYVNAGTGFHSNDARGAVISVDPKSGEYADRVTPLVRAKGAEVGLRTVRMRGLQSTVALWYWVSIPSCCSWATQEQLNPAGRAGASVSNGATTRESLPG